MAAGKLESILSLVVLTALAVGFGAWSGLTGPELTSVDLQVASADLASASGFLATQNITESVVGSDEVVTVQESVDWQAPDRVALTQTTRVTDESGDYTYVRTLTQIGDSCWSVVVRGPADLKPLACTTQSNRLKILTAAETAGAIENDGVYLLSPGGGDAYLSSRKLEAFGMVSIEMRISGDYLSWQRFAFDESVSGANVEVVEVVGFKDVGNAPPVARPSGDPTEMA
jgi:hypothetical protein